MAKSKEAQQLEELAETIKVCKKCPLHGSRTHAVPGEGNVAAEILIIGEAPGKDEDKQGRPFVGAAGRFLDQLLEEIGLKRQDCFITNIVKCRPPQNRTPKNDEIDTCTASYLDEQVELIRPRLIILLGGVAAKKMLGAKRIGDVRGEMLERDGRRYFVSYHPAVRFYREDLGEKLKEDFAQLKRELSTL